MHCRLAMVTKQSGCPGQRIGDGHWSGCRDDAGLTDCTTCRGDRIDALERLAVIQDVIGATLGARPVHTLVVDVLVELTRDATPVEGSLTVDDRVRRALDHLTRAMSEGAAVAAEALRVHRRLLLYMPHERLRPSERALVPATRLERG